MYRLLAAALLTLCSGSVHAFESNEHKRIGDLSYHIALKSFCAQKPDSPVCGAKTGAGLFFNPLVATRTEEDTRPTYGDLVMCVDYFLSAEKLIAGREKDMVRGYGSTRDSLYPASAGELELEVSIRCSAGLDNWEGARAGHVNHNHFQQEVLLAQRNNHGLSLYLAATSPTVFSALAVNAISDHYLHDTFAPGHITTWRNKLSDVVANSYHDYRNRNGLNVKVNLDLLRSNAKLDGTEGTPTALATAFEVLASTPGADHFFCEHPDEPKFAPCPARDAGNAKKRLDALQASIHGAPDTTTVFKGDKFLYADSKDQDIQRFVMLMTAVRSIHDVLESHNPGAAVALKDSFSTSSWTWNYAKDDSTLPTLLPSSAIIASTGPVTYHVARRYSTVGEAHDRNRIDNHNLDKIFGINLGIDNMTFGNNQSRYYAGLEAVLAGFTLFDGFRGKLPLEKDIGNLAWTVGIQPFVSPGPNGVALTSRLLMILPETETAFSLQLKALRLVPVGQRHTWRPYVGLRMDMGLTSFMTMYLQAGKDAAVQRDGSIRSGPSVGGGIQLGAPTCRIPGIQKIFCP